MTAFSSNCASKNSEIGIVPHHWDVEPLGEFTDRVTYGFTNPMPTETSGPFMVTAKDIIGGKINYTTARHTTWDAYHTKLTDKSRPRVGDVLLTKDGSIGRVAVCDRHDVCINQSVALLQTNDRIVPLFLKYLLECPHYQHRMAGDAGGTTIKHIYITRVDKMQIAVPPLPTQRKIAGVLSAYDDLIENNIRRIAILEEMAQAIYREWFVNFRFPGNENVKLVESPMGKIPEGWKVEPLSEVADINALSIKKGCEFKEINYVDIASVSTGQIDEVRMLPFSEAPGRARRIVRHGDVIWSTVRPNRKSYSLIMNQPTNMVVSTGFAVITGTKAPFTYLYHTLTTEDYVGYLVNHATGSAYPAVNSGDFEKSPILVPPQDILSAFHKFVEPMFLAKQCMLAKSQKLRASRDLLLPKLISGQLDVEELDIEIGETLAEVQA